MTYVRCTQYVTGIFQDSFHVFVLGHALHPDESTYTAANQIAAAFKQKELPITTYGSGLPTTENHEVYEVFPYPE